MRSPSEPKDLTPGTPKRTETDFRKTIYEEVRPWGKFRCYPHGNTGNLKIITVKPGQALSLQYHLRRSEFWVVLDPGLEMTLGKRTWRPKRGEEIFIPRRTAHRLRCVGRRPGRVMEVWIGRSSESDIVRLEDDFGRVT
ncbi:MAG: phosphomannose isomerase type II C-terminal cupin domain [Candidatus Aminicenantales bacterium]